jgi:hypothetical protein
VSPVVFTAPITALLADLPIAVNDNFSTFSPPVH